MTDVVLQRLEMPVCVCCMYGKAQVRGSPPIVVNPPTCSRSDARHIRIYPPAGELLPLMCRANENDVSKDHNHPSNSATGGVAIRGLGFAGFPRTEPQRTRFLQRGGAHRRPLGALDGTAPHPLGPRCETGLGPAIVAFG